MIGNKLMALHLMTLFFITLINFLGHINLFLFMLLFLRLNRHLWDMEMVQKVIRDKSSDADFDDE